MKKYTILIKNKKIYLLQGANGHVKHNDTQSIGSHDSVSPPANPNMDLLAPPDPDDKFTYSDMSIGLGMDISIRGEGDLNDTKESYDENGWRVGREAGFDDKEEEQDQAHPEEDRISFAPEDIKHVHEVIYDPVDEVVVEDCCPEVCYRTCPCCIGDPDSPFWQLWYRHRLQVSR